MLWVWSFPLNSTSICKRRLFEEFRDLIAGVPKDNLPVTLRCTSVCLSVSLCLYISLSTIHRNVVIRSYHQMKRASLHYWRARREFLDCFPTWYTNDEVYEQFELEQSKE